MRQAIAPVIRRIVRESSQGGAVPSLVFDRALKARQRSAAVVAGAQEYDYLRVECAERLVDRLDDISRSFPTALELGSCRGAIASALRERNGPAAENLTGGVANLFICEHGASGVSPLTLNGLRTEFLDLDEENLIFEDSSVDLVLSSLSLHWVNNIQGTLRKIRSVLKPDGAYIGCMLGGSTLQELRHSFYLAEQERKGGISPHCSPLVRPSDVAALMQGAGFNLPTIDIDNITVHHYLFQPNKYLSGSICCWFSILYR